MRIRNAFHCLHREDTINYVFVPFVTHHTYYSIERVDAFSSISSFVLFRFAFSFYFIYLRRSSILVCVDFILFHRYDFQFAFCPFVPHLTSRPKLVCSLDLMAVQRHEEKKKKNVVAFIAFRPETNGLKQIVSND